MKKGFATADTDSDGFLSAEDLLRYMNTELGEEITLEDAETMMITADVQHRGSNSHNHPFLDIFIVETSGPCIIL